VGERETEIGLNGREKRKKVNFSFFLLFGMTWQRQKKSLCINV